MNPEPSWISLLVIGLTAGVAMGLFGIGGGVIILPGLIYWLGFSQHRATGTSLAIMLPPIGLAAVAEFYRHGNVDLRAALIIATAMFAGGWVGAWLADYTPGPYLRLGFGVLVVVMGITLIVSATRQLGWF
jgi:uncharacterized membrane protein YfcA